MGAGGGWNCAGVQGCMRGGMVQGCRRRGGMNGAIGAVQLPGSWRQTMDGRVQPMDTATHQGEHCTAGSYSAVKQCTAGSYSAVKHCTSLRTLSALKHRALQAVTMQCMALQL